MHGFLERHGNLFMSLKVGRDSVRKTRPLRRANLKDSWRALIRDYPDRFVIGSDQFYVTPDADRRFFHHTTPSRLLVN